MIALGLVTVLGFLLNSAIGRERATEQRLSDQRTAVRLAEHALLNLQHDQPLPTATSYAKIEVRAVTGGAAPAGLAWATVDAQFHGRRATLLGLVPASALASHAGEAKP